MGDAKEVKNGKKRDGWEEEAEGKEGAAVVSQGREAMQAMCYYRTLVTMLPSMHTQHKCTEKVEKFSGIREIGEGWNPVANNEN
jgi:hypothetical protein